MPPDATDHMQAEGYEQNEHMDEAWHNMLAARPPIPPDVWEQMVERGARARCNSFGAIPWDEADDEMRDHYQSAVSEILAAALGISDE